jgi:hypothetical protein
MAENLPNTYAGGVHVVRAIGDGQTRYWAVATRREQAILEVQQLLPPGWIASITERHLTPDQVAALNMHPGSVRELKNEP